MQNQARPGHGAADWLSLAAAPTFAFMALLTAVPRGGPLDMLWFAAPAALPPGGSADLRLHGAADGCSRRWSAGHALLGRAGGLPLHWNGAHVPADERLPSGALAEADLQPTNSASELGVLGIACVRSLETDERSCTAGQHFELGLQGVARTDMEARQPLAQAGAEPGGQAGLITEIDDVELALRRQPRDRFDQRVLPARDHRQAVGKEDARETRHAEQPGGIECRGIGARQRDAMGNVGTSDELSGRVQHLARDVDAVQLRLRPSLSSSDQVARRAAADLEHTA